MRRKPTPSPRPQMPHIVCLVVGGQEGALLDDQALKGELGVGPAQQFAFYTVSGGKAEHQDGPVLAQTMAAVHGLRRNTGAGKEGRSVGVGAAQTGGAVHPKFKLRFMPCLHVVVRVPVRVVDDDGIGSRQVDAQTTGTRGKQESKHVGLGVKLFHGGLAVLPADGAVDAACRVSHLGQVAVQQVQHLGHLR